VTTALPHLTAHRMFEEYPNAEFGPPQSDFLAEAFPQMRCDSSDPSTLRFFRPGGWVQVWPQGDPSEASCPAGYELWAGTEAQLLDLYELLWPCHGPPVQLYPASGGDREQLEFRFLDRFPRAKVVRVEQGATW